MEVCKSGDKVNLLKSDPTFDSSSLEKQKLTKKKENVTT